MSISAGEQMRRRSPRIFDTDWLVLRKLRQAIGVLSERASPDMTAVDFGCGSKPYADLFIDRGVTYLGADFGSGAELRITDDGRLLCDDGIADIVLSFQVLEHVRDLDMYFAEARRALKPDGWMILSTHGAWLYHPHPEDHRRWTREGLRNDIETRGFKVEGCEAVVGPLGWTTIFRMMGFVHFLRKIPVVGHAVAGVIASLMNARAALEDLITPQRLIDNDACIYVMFCRPEPERR